MPRSETIVSLFVASPADVSEERSVLDAVVQELNSTWSKSLAIRFELLKWERSVRPGIGMYAQAVINEQIGDEYDILVAIFWGRIGSPTPNFPSGTTEELSLAVERHRANPNVDIMVYFKDAPIAPSKIDTDQLDQLNNLKSKLQTEGVLYFEFVDASAFESMVRNHLSMAAQKFSSRSQLNSSSPKISRQHGESLPSASPTLPLDDDDLGLLDYSEISEDKFASMNRSLLVINDATVLIGQQMNKRTEQIEDLIASKEAADRGRVRKIMDLTSDDINQFSHAVNGQARILTECRIAAFDALSHAVALQVDFGSEGPNETLAELDHLLTEILTGVDSALSGITGFRDSLAVLPRLSVDVNRAKKRAVAVLDTVISEMIATRTSANDVKRTISELEARANQ